MRPLRTINSLSRALVCHMTEEGERSWSPLRIIFLVALPCVAGYAGSNASGHPEAGTIGQVVAIYAVLSAVLVGIIPLIHTITIGHTPAKSGNEDPDELIESRTTINSLRDTMSLIAVSVILLVSALMMCLLLLIAISFSDAKQGSPPADPGSLEAVLRCGIAILMGVVYACGASSVATFFVVATSVYDAIESDAQSAARDATEQIDDAF